MREAYHEARLVLAQVDCKNSDQTFRVVAYYGQSGEYAKIAAEASAILNCLAKRPDVATVVAGDFNILQTHPV